MIDMCLDRFLFLPEDESHSLSTSSSITRAKETDEKKETRHVALCQLHADCLRRRSSSARALSFSWVQIFADVKMKVQQNKQGLKVHKAAKI